MSVLAIAGGIVLAIIIIIALPFVLFGLFFVPVYLMSLFYCFLRGIEIGLKWIWAKLCQLFV